jgi:hypothetical protein
MSVQELSDRLLDYLKHYPHLAHQPAFFEDDGNQEEIDNIEIINCKADNHWSTSVDQDQQIVLTP